jgi:hypothetical protein
MKLDVDAFDEETWDEIWQLMERYHEDYDQALERYANRLYLRELASERVQAQVMKQALLQNKKDLR